MESAPVRNGGVLLREQAHRHPDSWRGMLIGSALGDAWGRLTEFLPYWLIFAATAGRGPGLPHWATVTDDTQMLLRFATALNSAETPAQSMIQSSIATQYLAWLEDPHNSPLRAPGGTCLKALRRLSRVGVERWEETTVVHSKGCGANMRVAPAGFLPKPLIEPVSAWQAALTHGHPVAAASAVATASIVHLMLDPEQWKGGYLETALSWIATRRDQPYHWAEQWLGDLPGEHHMTPEAFMREGLGVVHQSLLRAAEGVSQTGDPCTYGGQGWVADEALATALLCLDRNPDSVLDALRCAAMTTGDSDSIASLAGAVGGARNGASSFEGRESRLEKRYLAQISTLTSLVS